MPAKQCTNDVIGAIYTNTSSLTEDLSVKRPSYKPNRILTFYVENQIQLNTKAFTWKCNKRAMENNIMAWLEITSQQRIRDNG